MRRTPSQQSNAAMSSPDEARAAGEAIPRGVEVARLVERRGEELRVSTPYFALEAEVDRLVELLASKVDGRG